VALTAGSPLSRDSLPRDGTDSEPQLCLFHVIKEVNKRIWDGGRAVQNRRQRQGNQGRKKRRGRPRQQAQKQTQDRQGMSKQEQATFRWDQQSLIVRTEEDRREQEKQDLARMWPSAPARPRLRACNPQFDRLFARGMTQPCARYRRRRLVHKRPYQPNAFLAKALQKLRPDKFDQMLVFRGWDNGERTNKHVERHNRGFRMMQKTRDKRRTAHTLAKALALELYARMLAQPLYQHHVRELPVHFQETAILAMAA
jgi:hypothetical protein